MVFLTGVQQVERSNKKKRNNRVKRAHRKRESGVTSTGLTDKKGWGAIKGKAATRRTWRRSRQQELCPQKIGQKAKTQAQDISSFWDKGGREVKQKTIKAGQDWDVKTGVRRERAVPPTRIWRQTDGRPGGSGKKNNPAPRKGREQQG